MKNDFKRLMRRKKLKGEEVGKFVLTNDANAYNKILTGTDDEVIPQSLVQQLINKLEDDEEIEKYNSYIKIQSWIIKNYTTASGHEQQAQLAIEKIRNLLDSLYSVEKIKDFFLERELEGCEELIKKLNYFRIEDFLKGDEMAEGEVRICKAYYGVLKRSLYFMNGFNIALDLIIKYYDLEAVEVYKSRVDWFEEKLKLLSKVINLAFEKIKKSPSEVTLFGEEFQIRKLKTFNDIFEKIELKKYAPSGLNLKKAEELIKSGEGFEKTPELIDLVAEYEGE